MSHSATARTCTRSAFTTPTSSWTFRASAPQLSPAGYCREPHRLRFERPTFRVFFISGCDHYAFQGVPCSSLPCVPMFLCGIMHFRVNKLHEAMEES